MSCIHARNGKNENNVDKLNGISDISKFVTCLPPRKKEWLSIDVNKSNELLN